MKEKPKPRHKPPVIADTVLDQVSAGLKPNQPEVDSLLDRLKKARAERALNAEMDHHPAYGDPGNNRFSYSRRR